MCSGLTNRIACYERDRTLRIELLVTIIIIGILAAIALPSFLNQAAKAKQSEAKSYVGSVNRAQQAYRLEHADFATDTITLEIGIPTQTTDYKYAIPNGASTTQETLFQARPRDTTTLRAYAGGVAIVNGQTSAATCQTTAPSANAPAVVFDEQGASCGAGSEQMR